MNNHNSKCIVCSNKVRKNIHTKWKVNIGEKVMPESKFTLFSSSSNDAVKTWRCHLEKPYELKPHMYNRRCKVPVSSWECF